MCVWRKAGMAVFLFPGTREGHTYTSTRPLSIIRLRCQPLTSSTGRLLGQEFGWTKKAATRGQFQSYQFFWWEKKKSMSRQEINRNGNNSINPSLKLRLFPLPPLSPAHLRDVGNQTNVSSPECGNSSTASSLEWRELKYDLAPGMAGIWPGSGIGGGGSDEIGRLGERGRPGKGWGEAVGLQEDGKK